MNIIQMMERTDFYNDRYKSARFADSNYMDAFNSAAQALFKDKTDNKKIRRPYSFQSSEQMNRELYTLIKTATIVPTGDVVVYPADFEYYAKLSTTISGTTMFCRPATLNEIGPLEQHPLRKPSPSKPYYIETATGLQIYYGIGTFTSSSLTYLKTPNVMSIGNEDDKITAGGAVLTNGVTYMVYADCVQNGTTYYAGETFVAAGTSLTSGIVILNSLIVNCDFPVIVQDEICKKASDIMNGTIEDYNKAMFMQKQTESQ